MVVREIPAAFAAIEAVGAGAEAEVGRAVPIAAVVERLAARASEVADLILLETSLFELPAQGVILAHHLVVGGEHHPTPLHLQGQGGAGLDGEGVGGEVIYQLKIEN